MPDQVDLDIDDLDTIAEVRRQDHRHGSRPVLGSPERRDHQPARGSRRSRGSRRACGNCCTNWETSDD